MSKIKQLVVDIEYRAMLFVCLIIKYKMSDKENKNWLKGNIWTSIRDVQAEPKSQKAHVWLPEKFYYHIIKSKKNGFGIKFHI